jgi:hypothetical protein
MGNLEDREFKPISNPYIVGNPIRDPHMFFGREDDFAYVKNKFAGTKEGGMIVLCGARRSGKTSILFQILGGRLGPDFLPVLIDMQSMAIRNDQDMLAKIAQEVAAAIDHPAVNLAVFEAGAEENPYTAFEDLARAVNRELSDKRLVLMFDEYELFETNIDSGIISTRILNLLANLIEHKRIFVVFTGSDNLEARNKPYWQIFLSKALHRRISFLSRRDTLRLATEPLKDMVHYAEGIPGQVFELTAGQPFYTQVLCQSLVDRLNELHRYGVVAEDIRAVVDEIIENPLPQMIFSWNALSDLEKLSLSIAAELGTDGSRPVSGRDIIGYLERENVGYRLDPNELNKALENLFHCDVLQKQAGGDAYTFKMDLWRFWVKRMHSVWQVIDEMERSTEGPVGKGITSEDMTRRSRLRLILITAVALAIIAPVIYWLVTLGPRRAAAPAAETTLLSVATTPGQASIRVGDQYIGRSPIVEANIPVGERLLTIELAGYRTLIDTILLEEKVPLDLTYRLAEISGGLSITSRPSGAEILVDGHRLDRTTPAVVASLSAREIHTVELKLAGYATHRFDGVRLRADSISTLNHVFSKMTGSLSIVTNPAGAEVRLDGQPVETTPCNLRDITYGPHSLILSKEGYLDHEQEVDVSSPTGKVEISLDLLPPGTVVFNIQPYADVYIDGELVKRDVTYHEITLAPGAHEIELRHPQFGVHRQEIRLESDESLTVQHRFSSPGAQQ